jgi:tRNA(adenine34) deaminase
MKLALEQAKTAERMGEIPVGAVLVKDESIVASNHNRTRQFSDQTAHAEKLVIEEVIRNGEKFLYDYTLYVTLEPCLMCTGFIIHSRVGRVVFSAWDPKAGCCGSIYNMLKDKSLNHHPEVYFGVLEEECSSVLTDFFVRKRKGKK